MRGKGFLPTGGSTTLPAEHRQTRLQEKLAIQKAIILEIRRLQGRSEVRMNDWTAEEICTYTEAHENYQRRIVYRE